MITYEEVKPLLKEAEKKMKKTIEDLIEDFAQIRTGRATPALVEDILVEAYGQKMPLKQLASISIPEARLIVIDVWDKSNLESVEKAIQSSGRNLTPQNDGKVIRITLPELSEEQRKEYVKVARQKAEEHRVAIRNIRRHVNEELKKKKEKGLPEDDYYRLTEEVQKLTDKYIKEIDQLLRKKEEDILRV